MIDDMAVQQNTKFIDVLPYKFTSGGCIVYNNKIHLIGGQSGTKYEHYAWDGFTWENVSTLPFPFLGMNRVVVYQNKIHVLGMGSNGDFSKHYSWDGTTWVSESVLPIIKKISCAVTYNNMIHLFNYDNNKHYVWNGTAWSLLPAISVGTPSMSSCAVVYNNKIHLFSVNSYKHITWDGSQWQNVDSGSLTDYHTAVVFNGEIHMCDGSQHQSWNGDYTTYSSFPNSYYHCGVVAFNGQLEILGGGSNSSSGKAIVEPTNHLHWVDPIGDIWTNEFNITTSWLTPKTNWKKSDLFTYVDYNRIKNNLLYLNEKLNELYPDKAMALNLGGDLSYSGNYPPSKFNAFEDALQSFTRVGKNVNVGDKKTYYGNTPFIAYDDLNRLESCCLNWYNLEPIIEGVTIAPKSFTLDANETKQLTITVSPSDATYTVAWTSSDASVATVNSNGLVTSVNNGIATISAIVSQNGQPDITVIATCIVNIQASSIEVTPSNVVLTYKQPVTFNVVIEPTEASSKQYTSTSSNTGIITVNQNEGVAGKTEGDATVTFSVGGVSTTVNVKNLENKMAGSSCPTVEWQNKIYSRTSQLLDTSAPTNGVLMSWNGTKWSQISALPYKGAGLCGFTAYNNALHIVGGLYGEFGKLVELNKHYKWNGTSWSKVGTFPIAIDSPELVVLNNELHSVGGWCYKSDGKDTKTCGLHYKYNGGSWQYVDSLPQNICIGNLKDQVVVYNNQIHAFPVYRNYEDYSDTFEKMTYHYIFNGTGWIQQADAPTHGHHIVFDNKIHLFGMGSLNNNYRKHYVYDGTAWTKLADLDTFYNFTSFAVYDNHLYGIGGGITTDDFDYSNKRNMVQII